MSAQGKPVRAETRIGSLDALRGLASLAVFWFHLVHFNDWIPQGALKSSSALGYLGVEVFFVLSGFVIPHSLQRSGYSIRHYGTFLLKRMLRLGPPYYAALAFVIALGYASNRMPGFRGEPFRVSGARLGQHLTYTVDILGGDWLNYVFWTLAIELQYYLLIGLIFPLAVGPVRSRVGIAVATGAMAFLVPWGALVFHWGFLFLLGIVTFQFKAALIEKKSYLALLVLCSVGVLGTLGLVEAIAGLATAGAIAFAPSASEARRGMRGLQGPLRFLGDISYSLYLLHMPIYPKVFSLTMRVLPGTPGIVTALALSIGLTITAAYAMFRLVEQPAQRWSAAVRYRSTERDGGSKAQAAR